MKRITNPETQWDVLGEVYNAVDRLREIENILGDDYDLERLKELVEKDKSQKLSSVYDHLPEEGQEVWYWDSCGILRGIIECVDKNSGEFEIYFSEEDYDIFIKNAWGTCVVKTRKEALEKMKEGEK